MLLRIISMGGLRPYLSQPWNVFDATMVAAGYTTFLPVSASNGAGLEGIKALRALRALRPLRTITRCAARVCWVHAAQLHAPACTHLHCTCWRCVLGSPRRARSFPALRSIVVCFLEAVPLLVSVAAMLFFFLFIFAGWPALSLAWRAQRLHACTALQAAGVAAGAGVAALPGVRAHTPRLRARVQWLARSCLATPSTGRAWTQRAAPWRRTRRRSRTSLAAARAPAPPPTASAR